MSKKLASHSEKTLAPGRTSRSAAPGSLVVGLTGGVASGKSTVARLLADHGAIIVDADEIARFVVEPGQAGLVEIVRRFGPQFVDGRGRLRRKALGRRVFGDETARRDLETILHPLIRQEMKRRLESAPPDTIIVLDVPLLFETRQVLAWVDATIVVYADRATQLSRMQVRDGLSREEAARRLEAQWPLSCKLAAADYVIYNQSDREALERQVADVWDRLQRVREQYGVKQDESPCD